MSTVAQIVQKIIDDLSDGISQLVLLVVVLQEQNAEVPAQLPAAAGVVVKTAQTLVKIAKNLADNNYKQFPDIQREIHEASDAVDKSAGTMTNAVNVLSTSTDRMSGWTGLVEACRIMSGKTIRLLQIVYGAELKRLFATADQLLDGFDALDPNRAKTDPHGFAKDASDLASKANQLAKYVEDRAKDEDAPGVKAKLMDQANRLRSAARGLIDDVNDLLSNPDDERKKAKVRDAVDGLKDLIGDAKKTVMDNQTVIPEKDMPGAQSVQPKFKGDPFKDLEDLKKQCDRVERGAKMNDPQTVKDAGSEVPHLGRKAVAAAKSAADSLPGSAKSRALDALKDLEDQIPKQVKDTDDYLRSPNDPKKKDNVIDDAEDTKDIVDDLASALRNEKPDAIEAINRLARTLGNLDDGARGGDMPKVDKNAKKIPRQGKGVDRAARDAADRTSNPKQAKAIKDALDRLNPQLPKVESDANNLSKSPNDPKTKDRLLDDNRDARDALDDLKNAILGDPLAAIDRLAHDMDKLEQAANRGDMPKMERVGKKDMPPHGRDCVDLCRDAANKCPNSRQRDRIKDAVDKLARQLPNNKSDVDNSLKSPNSQPAKDKVADDAEKTKDILKDLKNAILGLDPNSSPSEISPLAKPAEQVKKSIQALADTAKKGDKDRLPARVDEARDGLDNLKNLARDAADKLADPEKKQQIYDTIDDVDSYFPTQVGQARDTANDPKDKQKAKRLQNTTDALKDLLDELVDETKPATLYDNAKLATKKLDDLVGAKNKGNEPKVDKLADEVDDLASKIGDQAKYVAAKSNSPAQAQDVHDAVKDLDDKMGNLGKDVSSRAPARRVGDDANGVKGAIKNTVDKANGEPISAIDKLLKTLGKVQNAGKAEDTPKLKKQGTNIPPQGRDVAKLARDAANRCNDPQQKKRINDLVDDMEYELPHELDKIKKALDKPSDPKTKKDLDDETEACKDILNRLKDALAGRVPASNPAVKDAMDAVNELSRLKPRLDDSIDKVKKNPNDKQAKKDISQIVPEIAPVLKKLQDAVLDPDDEVAYAAEALKNAMDDLQKNVDKADSKGAIRATKDLMDAKKDLDAKANALGDRIKDPKRKKDLDDALKEVHKLMPAAVKSAKDALGNPKDEKKGQEFDAAARALKRAADLVGKAARPRQSPESQMLEAKGRIQDALKEIDDASKRNDKPGLKRGFRKLKDAGDDFMKAYRLRRGPIKHLPPSNEPDPMEELKKLWDKFGIGKNKMLDNPKDPQNKSDWDNWGKDLNKWNDKALEEVKAKQLKPIQDVEDALQRLEDSARREEPQLAAKRAKDLVNATQKMHQAVAAEPDPTLKKKLQDALSPVNGLVKDLVNDTKDWMKDPKNPDKKSKIKEDADRLRAPLGRAKALISGTPDRDLAAKALKCIADCADVKTRNREKPQLVKGSIDDLEKDGKDLANGLKRVADKADVPDYKKAQLKEAADALIDRIGTLKSTDPSDKPAIENNTDKVEDKLRDILDDLGADDVDDLIRSKARAKQIMASLRDASEDLDALSLLEAADELSRRMAEMMDIGVNWARGQEPTSDRSRAALNMDRLLAQIENTPTDSKYSTNESLDSIVSSLSDLTFDTNPEPASEGVFERAIEEVAQNVKKAVNEHHGILEARNIAETLAILAQAARKGERQKMIMAGRTLSTQIQEFIKVLLALANRVAAKNPMYQDRLIKFANALRNYATQMKILISVKAASIEKDADADESLASITRSLGHMITDAVTTMDIVKVTILKERN